MLKRKKLFKQPVLFSMTPSGKTIPNFIKPGVKKRTVQQKAGQLNFLTTKKDGSVSVNQKLEFIKNNKKRIIEQKKIENKKKESMAREKKALAAHQRTQKIKSVRQTKINAYNLAWQVIKSPNFHPNNFLVRDAWMIVKKMGIAKGESKIGRTAKFKRIFEATPENLKGLEINNVTEHYANKFMKMANERLKNKNFVELD